MDRISKEVFHRKKMTVQLDSSKPTLHARDLLTLLIRNNLSLNIPESHRLSDEDVMARTCTGYSGSRIY
jgi:hypothetical protein